MSYTGYPPCPPATPKPCPQVCPPPPPAAPCRAKPIMRGLHWTQTTSILRNTICAAIVGGACIYFFIGRPRRETYADYYRKAELDEMENDMARKGLFQAVPKESLKD